jgi:catechol 2,3-dioxygenase-like lactoylglutathione lyase family enzyme
MELAIAVLPTRDLAVAKTFYVDTLGFSVTWEVSEDGHTGLLGLARGTMQITLDCPMDGHGRQACVSLHVTSADAYHREWSQKIEGLEAPRTEEWGARTFSVQDPSDNTIFVISPLR